MFSNEQIPFYVKWFASDETELICLTCDPYEVNYVDYHVTVLDFLSAPPVRPDEMEASNESLFKCDEAVRHWAISKEIKKMKSE